MGVWCGEKCDRACTKKAREQISDKPSGTGDSKRRSAAPEIGCPQDSMRTVMHADQQNMIACRTFQVTTDGVSMIEAGCRRKECGECICRRALNGEREECGSWVKREVQETWMVEFMSGAVAKMVKEATEAMNVEDEDGQMDEDDEIFGVNAIGYPTARRPIHYHREFDTETAEGIVRKWFATSRVTIGEGACGDIQRERAMRLLYTWRDIFEDDLSKVPVCDLVQHYIPTYPGSRPHKASNPIFTLEEVKWMKENLPKMVKAGITTHSDSPWSSRPKFVPKSKGGLRMVHVFCPLNKATIKSNYPMRRIEPIIQSLMQWRWTVFWQADATVGYWGIRLAPQHAYKTAFNTPIGQFCYLRMGMGLSGAPHTYSRMKDILAGAIPSPHEESAISGTSELGAYEYFQDDDYGGNPTFEAQVEFLMHHYFPRVCWAGLMLSPPKCLFFMKELKLLGFAGSGEGGLRPSLDKIGAIRDFPRPESAEEVERFVNMTGYLRQWIPGRAEHAKALKSAIMWMGVGAGKKGVGVKWQEQHEESFVLVKQAVEKNVIWGGDPELQYHLATDASAHALGGVLFQLVELPVGTMAQPKYRSNERIIMFISKSFAPAETRYHTTEREALAVVRCLEEVRWLVVGSPHPVKLYTDHQALVSILKGDDARGRLVRWQFQLAEYNLEIHHVPGVQNVLADGMSRMTTRRNRKEREVMAAEVVKGEKDKWGEWMNDEWYGMIVEYKLTAKIPYEKIVESEGQVPDAPTVERWKRRMKQQSPRFVMMDGEGTSILLYREKGGGLAKCAKKDEVRRVLQWAHDVHGHFSEGITLKNLITRYYWPTRHRDVAYYCKSCPNCQKVGPLRPSQSVLPIIQLQPMDLLGMDFIGPLTPVVKGTGSRYILIIVDYFSRYLFAKAVRTASSGEVIAMLGKVGQLVGWPRAIYNDNGSHFVSANVQDYLRARGVRQFPAPKSHPSSVGLAERYVQLVVIGLRTFLQHSPAMVDHWDVFIPQVVHSINTRVIRTHGYTPSQLLFGFNMRQAEMDATGRDVVISSTLEDFQHVIAAREQINIEAIKSVDDLDKVCSVETWMYAQRLSKLEEIREDVRTRMMRKGIPVRPGRFWEPPTDGDLVLLRRFEVDKQHGRKFEPRWEGPYRLEDIAWHGRSGRLKDIRTGEVVRVRKGGLQERVHMDDLKVFVPRDEHWLGFDSDLKESGQLKFAGMGEVLDGSAPLCGWVDGQREFCLREVVSREVR